MRWKPVKLEGKMISKILNKMDPKSHTNLLELLPSANFRNRLIVVNNRLIVLIINLNMTCPYWFNL